MLTPTERGEIEAALVYYPQRRNGCIDALKVVQQQRGWVSDEAVADVAALLGLSPAEVDGVATFYNLIYRRPVGRHVILLCDSVSCWLLGYEQIRQRIEGQLGISFGQTTADGQWTLLPNPCLGTCDHAPALMIDGELYQDVTAEGVAGILQLAQSRQGR